MTLDNPARPWRLRKHRINRRRFQVGGVGAVWLEACHFRSRYRQLNILFALGVIAASFWLGQHYRIEVLSHV